MNSFFIFGLLIALLLSSMPVSIALGLTVMTFLVTLTQVPLESVALKLFTGIERFEILAIPFFILAGAFLTHGGIAERMMKFSSAMVGHRVGGLGQSGIFACALFAALSGSSPATVVAIGAVLLPEMAKRGFPKEFGAGVVASSGSLGILIPPSIVMVMYAIATNTSVGALFIAGIVPGILLALTLSATCWFIAKKNNYPRQEKASWTYRLKTFKESSWGLFLIVIIIGGIYSGIFTPTEAAAVSAVYAAFVALFIYRSLKLSELKRVLLDAANLSSMLLYIITNAALFSFVMVNEDIPQSIATWLIDKDLGVITFLIAVNIILIIAGCFMEPSSIILIFAPILLPVALTLGVNPIHLGILLVVNMEVGMITPPVGLNLFVTSGLTNIGLTDLSRAMVPWLLTLIGFLIVVTYIPEISLWLPRLLGFL